MGTTWNGSDLQTFYSELLSDSSTAFKTRVLRWMNETQREICASHDWPFLRKKGKKLLTQSNEEQSLILGAPGAATAAIASGGSLTEDSVYSVKVTFEDSSGYETQGGTASGTATATSVNKTVSLTSIPTSGESLVTKRHIYLEKDSGGYFFHSTISDNTTTTASITTETTSTVEPPDFDMIRKLDGNPFFESDSGQLTYRPLDQLRLLFQGSWSEGTPNFWSDLGYDKVAVYPIPDVGTLDLSFYYVQLPKAIFAEATSQPAIPVWLEDVLKAGVLAKGYQYRDRDGWVSKAQQYENLLQNAISKRGTNLKTIHSVRDVVGNSDGEEIS